jgi:hypothetical protein
MITPREIIRGYISLLHILRQNPEATFSAVMGDAMSLVKADKKETENDIPDELADFEL